MIDPEKLILSFFENKKKSAEVDLSRLIGHKPYNQCG
jgi:hypothetical protein